MNKPLQKNITKGKLLDGFRLEPLPTGEIRIHYGLVRGWETVPSMDAAKAKVAPFLDRQEKQAQRMLQDVAAARRALA